MSIDIQKALAEWQENLRLQDWDITAGMLPNAEYEYRRKSADETASISIDRNRMMDAEIIIKETSKDKEFSLVHEIVHIIIEPLNSAFDAAIAAVPGEDSRKILKWNQEYELEILVNKLTRALLKVRDMAQEIRKEDGNDDQSNLRNHQNTNVVEEDQENQLEEKIRGF